MAKTTITSGEFRGHPLSTPDTGLTHPMGSREKLALFNALESQFGPLASTTRVLDCFCGSGALGLEAISRGAKDVVFVDQDSNAIKTTKQNIRALKVEKMTKVIKSDYKNLPENQYFLQNDAKFDIILTDPPYDNFPKNLEVLTTFLKNEGIIVLSHPTSVNPAEILPGLTLLRSKKHAAANISFLVKHSQNAF